VLEVKNQYFGDVNDYMKYGLLRCFCAAGFRLGVCWMLTPDDGRSDGGKTAYLSNQERWRHHDPPLFGALTLALRARDGRHIRHAENGLLPGALFFSEVVPDDSVGRSSWFERAIDRLQGADLIFFDADNGIEVPSKPRGRTESSKYLYRDEIAATWSRGASLLVFQHFRRKARDEDTWELRRDLQRITPSSTIVALASANVLFLVASRPEHQPKTADALRRVESTWSTRIWNAAGPSNRVTGTKPRPDSI
jgi:hypothetical protein